MLEANLSRARQKRLLDQMAERKLDAVVVGDPQHVYYFSAFRPQWQHQAALVLFSDGRSWLTSANAPAEGAAADERAFYEAQWMASLRQEQAALVAGQVIEALKAGRAKEIGVDVSAVTSQVALMGKGADIEPIDPVLWQLRRRKDADELNLMRRAAACADAMYLRAREIVREGAVEMEVYLELEKAAIMESGELMTAPLGNDYRCGGGGGPPRADRACAMGELYVIDVGPTYRGYFADACRTFAVGGKPTDVQLEAHVAIAEALAIVEKMAKPGARCREIYEGVFNHLKGRAGAQFPHHLGHGVGLQPHEYPHLNPKWDDVLIEGEVFTAEPGLYATHLRGGIRLENLYHVTASGVEALTRASLDL
jgi:Xaa-Pro aminopeptidase